MTWISWCCFSVGASVRCWRGTQNSWPPWATWVRELKHLGVHVLQLKDGDPYPQARADRSAARSRPDRRAQRLGFEVKRTLCTATFYWPLWFGFDTGQPRGLGNSDITPQCAIWGLQVCKLHIEDTASSNTQVRSIHKIYNINLTQRM